MPRPQREVVPRKGIKTHLDVVQTDPDHPLLVVVPLPLRPDGPELGVCLPLLVGGGVVFFHERLQGVEGLAELSVQGREPPDAVLHRGDVVRVHFGVGCAVFCVYI